MFYPVLRLCPSLSTVFPFAHVCPSLSAFHPIHLRFTPGYPLLSRSRMFYPVFTHVYPQLSTFLLVLCLRQFIRYSRFHLFTLYVDPSLSTFLLVYPCLLLFYPRFTLFTEVYASFTRLTLFTHVYLSLSTLYPVYPCLPQFIHVSSRLLTLSPSLPFNASI